MLFEKILKCGFGQKNFLELIRVSRTDRRVTIKLENLNTLALEDAIETREDDAFGIAGIDLDEFSSVRGKMKDMRQVTFFKIKTRRGVDDLGQRGGQALEKMFLFRREKMHFVKRGDCE